MRKSESKFFKLSVLVIILLFSGCQNQANLQNTPELEDQPKVFTKQKLIDSINKDFEIKINKLGYIDSSDTVYDPSTNITWEDNINVKIMGRDFKQGKEYCQNKKFKNFDDWYLPTKDELLSRMLINKKFKRQGYIKVTDHVPYLSSSVPFWASHRNEMVIYNIRSNKVYDKSSYTSGQYPLIVTCARVGQIDTVTFDSPEKYKIYKSVSSNKKVFDKNSYSKAPFEEITSITNNLLELYMPNKIKKPILPSLPVFKKGEYETKAKFQIRVNVKIEEREDKIKQLQQQYREDVEFRNAKIKYIYSILTTKTKEFQEGAFKTVMDGFKLQKRSYDPETSTMYVNMKANMANYSKKVSLKVSPSDAKLFTDNIENVEVNPIFKFEKNQVVLESIDANYNKNKYLAVLNDKDFKPENIEVTIKDKKVKFDSAKEMRLSLQNPNLKDTYQVQALAYKDGKEIGGKSYDDDLVPLLNKFKQTKIDKTKWLVVIGIEKYTETDDITYSKRSAELFKKVAKKTLGIKERNVITLLDNKATGTAIKNKLRILLSEVKKGDSIYFYYNGHGIPDPSKSGEPYMLPADGIPDFIVSEKEFSLKNIYKQLSDSKANKVVAFVDSCFSGATDGVSIIKGVAGSRLAPKKIKFNKNKMVVLTAGQKKQYSNMYKEKGHRMFSYFVMKSLLTGKKDINMLYKEVAYKVSEASNELGALKKQEPTLDGNIKMKL